MVLLKLRSVPVELGVLRSLNTRMELSAEDRRHYVNLEKGYQGEVMFDQMTEKLQSELLVLNDLYFEVNGSIFQIDTLIVFQGTLYPFEVKNYEGDFYYESESFQTLSKIEINNPLDQLKRSKVLLRQLLQTIGVKLPVEGYVVFINPEFTLYQAPLNTPIVFSSQLNRFMKKLNQTPSKLNDRHRKLADQLISMSKPISPYTRLPTYSYEQLKKGIICPECYSFMISAGDKKVVCGKCGFEEDAESAILRSVEEIRLLFPAKKISTNCVHEWCALIGSKKMLCRILKENFKLRGYGQWTYYE